MSDRKLTLAPAPRHMTVTDGTCCLTANAYVLMDDRAASDLLRGLSRDCRR